MSRKRRAVSACVSLDPCGDVGARCESCGQRNGWRASGGRTNGPDSRRFGAVITHSVRQLLQIATVNSAAPWSNSNAVRAPSNRWSIPSPGAATCARANNSTRSHRSVANEVLSSEPDVPPRSTTDRSHCAGLPGRAALLGCWPAWPVLRPWRGGDACAARWSAESLSQRPNERPSWPSLSRLPARPDFRCLRSLSAGPLQPIPTSVPPRGVLVTLVTLTANAPLNHTTHR